MSRVAELLTEARSHGIRFVMKDDGPVDLKAPQAPPADLVDRLRLAKPAVVAALAVEAAAIPQEWREGVARLRGMECPQGVPLARWKALASDADRFLTQGWARLAAGLGWDTRTLFACHPRCPLVRYDVRGVLWLIDGNEIIALFDRGLVIRTPTRARLECRRPSFAAGEPVVMPWELTAQGEPSDAA